MKMRETDLEMDVFYDGQCLTCGQEVESLRGTDVSRSIHFVDTSSLEFDVERDAGIPIDRAMDCIQARLGSGEVLQGAVVLRLLREAASRAPVADLTPASSTPGAVDVDRLPHDDRPATDKGDFEVSQDAEFLECRKVGDR